MYVNATYAILCNNYGNNLILLFQISLVFLSCLTGIPQPPPAGYFPCVVKGLQMLEVSPSTPQPCESLSFLSSSPFLPSRTKPPTPRHLPEMPFTPARLPWPYQPEVISKLVKSPHSIVILTLIDIWGGIATHLFPRPISKADHRVPEAPLFTLSLQGTRTVLGITQNYSNFSWLVD